MKKTVTIGVASVEAVRSRLKAAFAGRSQGGPRISFVSHELLWRLMTPRRWQVLEVMTGAGPLALREVARRLGRDVKGVHTDVHALLDAGVIRRIDSGAFEFPYDAVRVDFTLRAAA